MFDAVLTLIYMKKIAVVAALSTALILIPAPAQAGGTRHILCRVKPGSEVVVIYKGINVAQCSGAVHRIIRKW